MVTKCEESQSRTRLSLGLLVLATILVWVVTGCQGKSPTPIAAVQPPEISEPKVGAPTPLKPGEEAGISVDVSSATGIDLTYTWHADGGEIVRGQESPAITYRAPGEPGTYNVRVVVEWDGQSVEKATSIKVEAEPTPEPTEEPTPEPISEPTEEPTPAATPIPDAVVAAAVNLRSGPGTEYDIISTLSPGQVLTVTGRIADATWLQVSTDQMQEGWVANQAELVTLNLPTERISVVSPPSTPTPSPPPTETPTLIPTAAPPTPMPPPTAAPAPTETPTPIPTAAPKPTPEPTMPTCLITAPADGDQDLGFENEVRVTCSDVPDSLYIWILVYSHFDSNFYPKPGPIGSGSGDYRGTAYLGTEGPGPGTGIGDNYGIIVALADEVVSRKLRQDAASFSGYELRLPDGVEEKDRITVRRGH